jgi:hypothetical protein
MSENLVQLAKGHMIVTFDKRYGSIHAIHYANDPFGTNFIGNEENTPGVADTDTRWTGDLVSTVWRLKSPGTAVADLAAAEDPVPGKWHRELTGCSRDIRRVSFDGESFTVSYTGKSQNEGGIQSYDLQMRYSVAADESLLWDIEIENTTGSLLEIGELGIPLMVNNHFAPFWDDVGLHQSTLGDHRQKRVHEERVIVHNFVGGHSSYSLVQRPLGDIPFLLVHPTQDTAFECLYKPEGPFGYVPKWVEPDVLAIHSWATQSRRKWSRPWINGCSSLMLQPGEKKNFQMRFVFIKSYGEIREQLYRSGNLGIRVLPSMVVQEGSDVYAEVLCQRDLDRIEFLSDGMTVRKRERKGNQTLLTLRFKGRGQKSLKLIYNGDKWTNLHFYCIEPIEQLLKARARFIVERQFYENPEDPFNRHHMFLPFDYRLRSTYLEADRVWEVGGSDEYGFSESLFLAEKNVYYPSRKEIETLELYVDDCLWAHIQDPETYDVQASLYWKERTLSSPWSHWSRTRAARLIRTYNYPHTANIYHALYRVGKRYGLTTHHEPLEYLHMAYRAAVKSLTTGPWRHVGLMCGSNTINILNDLNEEGCEEEHAALLSEMKACNQVFLDEEYPYGSELYVDETAHEQVFFYTRFFGNEAKARKTLQIIKALRGGDQPAWFLYGNDKRRYRYMGCWYSEALNGWALLQGFEDTGDREMLIKGYAGVMSVMANMLPDGMGFGFFRYDPHIFAPEPPCTLDNGIGQYGFFKAAKAYVVNDEAFGLVGYGCDVEEDGERLIVQPRDGLKKRVCLVEYGIGVNALQGEIVRLAYGRSDGSLELHVEDSTGVVHTAEFSVTGLKAEEVRVTSGDRTQIMIASDELTIALPMEEASVVRIEGCD